MSEIDEISARLTVLETVMRQLITHMAVRDDNPARWVQTRKALAISAIAAEGPGHAARLLDAIDAFFDQAQEVARDYSIPGRGIPGKPGTSRVLMR
jgi:hypothetical protein